MVENSGGQLPFLSAGIQYLPIPPLISDLCHCRHPRGRQKVTATSIPFQVGCGSADGGRMWFSGEAGCSALHSAGCLKVAATP
jgi:hypothetical protein